MEHHPRPAWLLTALAIGLVLAAWVLVVFARNLWVILNGLMQP